jgi:hypothetical protein
VSLAEPPAPAEGPILAELHELGYQVGSLAELRHSRVRYRDAIAVLVAALRVTTEPKTLMEVVRALSVPWAKPDATAPMILTFKTVPVTPGAPLNSLRWAVGNALDVLWDDTYFDDLVDLVRDRSFARDREMIVLGLGRSRMPEVGAVLIGLLDDPTVSGYAVKALRKLKIPQARGGLERMLGDDRAWVRKEAQRALAALGYPSGQMKAAAASAWRSP